MTLYFTGAFVALLLMLVVVFKQRLKSDRGLVFVLIAMSVAFGSIVVLLTHPEVFVSTPVVASQPAATTTARLASAASRVGGVLNTSLLFNLNCIIMLFSFLLWFMLKPNIDQQRKSFLIDLVGAWNKMDIDNSTEDLIHHGIKNKDDREWAKEVLMILKNYQPTQDNTGYVYEPKKEPGRSITGAKKNETGEESTPVDRGQ